MAPRLSEEGRASVATTKRIRALERELARKEKALAEAAALLVLKKKVTRLWGGRGRRHGRGERAVILAALDEAQTAGARLHAACQVIGISARTIERWKASLAGTTDGAGRGAGRAMRSPRPKKRTSSPS